MHGHKQFNLPLINTSQPRKLPQTEAHSHDRETEIFSPLGSLEAGWLVLVMLQLRGVEVDGVVGGGLKLVEGATGNEAHAVLLSFLLLSSRTKQEKNCS